MSLIARDMKNSVISISRHWNINHCLLQFPYNHKYNTAKHTWISTNKLQIIVATQPVLKVLVASPHKPCLDPVFYHIFVTLLCRHYTSFVILWSYCAPYDTELVLAGLDPLLLVLFFHLLGLAMNSVLFAEAMTRHSLLSRSNRMHHWNVVLLGVSFPWHSHCSCSFPHRNLEQHGDASLIDSTICGQHCLTGIVSQMFLSQIKPAAWRHLVCPSSTPCKHCPQSARFIQVAQGRKSISQQEEGPASCRSEYSTRLPYSRMKSVPRAVPSGQLMTLERSVGSKAGQDDKLWETGWFDAGVVPDLARPLSWQSFFGHPEAKIVAPLQWQIEQPKKTGIQPGRIQTIAAQVFTIVVQWSVSWFIFALSHIKSDTSSVSEEPPNSVKDIEQCWVRKIGWRGVTNT